MTLRDEDLRVDWFRPAPGHYVNVHANCVRITHLPTGLVTTCQAHRSYWMNKRDALQQLEALVAQHQQQQQQQQ